MFKFLEDCLTSKEIEDILATLRNIWQIYMDWNPMS